MDLVKSLHEVLVKHLGTEHRGKIQLGPEHDSLRKDLLNFMVYIANVNEISGLKYADKKAQIAFEQSHKIIENKRINLQKTIKEYLCVVK